MIGSIYGVDIKLTQTNGEVYPLGIEINGVDFGTDFFKYEEGFRYYKKLVMVLAASANSKPIFIQSHPDLQPLNPLEKIALEKEYNASFKERKEKVEKIASYLGESYDFEYSWLDDLLSFNLKNIDKQEANEHRWMEQAGRLLHIPIVLFEDLSFNKEKIMFKLLNGERREVPMTDIGLIWARSTALYDAPHNDLFLNSSLAEALSDSKPMFRAYGEGYHEELLDFFPSGVYYGFGITSKKELVSFLEGIGGNFVVRKRGGSYCGTGVEIFEKEELLKTLKGRQNEERSEKRRSMLYYILQQVIQGHHLEEFVSVYEEFAPSIPILNARTQQYHDGCIRAVVFKPKDQEPIFIDAQWRLAPAPLDAHAPLEEKLRANLSRGATPQDLSYEETALVEPFATRLVEEYEDLVGKIETSLSPVIPPVTNKERIKVMVLKHNFWGWLLMNHAREIGTYEVTHLKPDICVQDPNETIAQEMLSWERMRMLRKYADNIS